MRIRLLADGRVLEGTALQITRDMQSLSFNHDGETISRYIDACTDHLARVDGVHLNVEGDTDGEKAASFVNEMLARGLATSV